MVRTCAIVGLLLAVSLVAAEARSGGCAREVVYYYPDSVGRDRADILAFYQAYVDAEISPALGHPLTIRYFSELTDLLDYVRRCEQGGSYPAFATLHAELALQKRRQWGLELVGYVVDGNGRPVHTISAVVRRDSGLRSLADLADRTVLAPSYWGGRPDRFEQKVLGGELQLSQLARLEVTDSSISALLGVFYRRADAALASGRVFDVLRERSGNIWKALVVIHTSEPLPIAVTVSFRTTPERDHRIAAECLAKSHLTPSGRRWLDYVRLGRGQVGTWSDLFTDEELAAADREHGP